MTAHLSVVSLHVRNVGISLREPLETLSTCPASGLHTGLAALFHLLPGSIHEFDRTVNLWPLDSWSSFLVLDSPVCWLTVFFGLWSKDSTMHTLQNRQHIAKSLERRKKKKKRYTLCSIEIKGLIGKTRNTNPQCLSSQIGHSQWVHFKLTCRPISIFSHTHDVFTKDKQGQPWSAALTTAFGGKLRCTLDTCIHK